MPIHWDQSFAKQIWGSHRDSYHTQIGGNNTILWSGSDRWIEVKYHNGISFIEYKIFGYLQLLAFSRSVSSFHSYQIRIIYQITNILEHVPLSQEPLPLKCKLNVIVLWYSGTFLASVEVGLIGAMNFTMQLTTEPEYEGSKWRLRL